MLFSGQRCAAVFCCLCIGCLASTYSASHNIIVCLCTDVVRQNLRSPKFQGLLQAHSLLARLTPIIQLSVNGTETWQPRVNDLGDLPIDCDFQLSIACQAQVSDPTSIRQKMCVAFDLLHASSEASCSYELKQPSLCSAVEFAPLLVEPKTDDANRLAAQYASTSQAQGDQHDMLGLAWLLAGSSTARVGVGLTCAALAKKLCCQGHIQSAAYSVRLGASYKHYDSVVMLAQLLLLHGSASQLGLVRHMLLSASERGHTIASQMHNSIAKVDMPCSTEAVQRTTACIYQMLQQAEGQPAAGVIGSLDLWKAKADGSTSAEQPPAPQDAAWLELAAELSQQLHAQVPLTTRKRTCASARAKQTAIQIGLELLEGRKCEKNISAAFSWFEATALAGSPEAAALALRALYPAASSLKFDDATIQERAAKLLSQLVKQAGQDASLMYQTAQSGEAGARSWDDRTMIIHMYEQLVETGHVDAIVRLATILHLGIGCSADISRAAALYKRAADLGHTQSMCQLADLLRSGHGCNHDPRAARRLLRQAAAAQELPFSNTAPAGSSDEDLQAGARAGHIESTFFYAHTLQLSHDPQIASQANKWYTRAAKMGHKEAMMCLWRTRREHPQNEQWLQQAAERGHMEAAYLLGMQECAHDESQATLLRSVWLCRAANAGHAKACLALARAMRTIRLATKPCREHDKLPKEEADWFRKAAEQYLPEAFGLMTYTYTRPEIYELESRVGYGPVAIFREAAVQMGLNQDSTTPKDPVQTDEFEKGKVSRARELMAESDNGKGSMEKAREAALLCEEAVNEGSEEAAGLLPKFMQYLNEADEVRRQQQERQAAAEQARRERERAEEERKRKAAEKEEREYRQFNPYY